MAVKAQSHIVYENNLLILGETIPEMLCHRMISFVDRTAPDVDMTWDPTWLRCTAFMRFLDIDRLRISKVIFVI